MVFICSSKFLLFNDNLYVDDDLLIDMMILLIDDKLFVKFSLVLIISSAI